LDSSDRHGGKGQAFRVKTPVGFPMTSRWPAIVGKLRRVYPKKDASRERLWASKVFLFGSVGYLVADFFDPKKWSI